MVGIYACITVERYADQQMFAQIYDKSVFVMISPHVPSSRCFSGPSPMSQALLDAKFNRCMCYIGPRIVQIKPINVRLGCIIFPCSLEYQ